MIGGFLVFVAAGLAAAASAFSGDSSESSTGEEGAGKKPSLEKRKRIVKILATLESNLNYGAISGFDPKVEFSYGILQTRLRTGGIELLLGIYARRNGRISFSRFGDLRNSKLSVNKEFRRLLVEAGKETAMIEAQDEYFAKYYLEPAFKFAEELGFRSASSYLVVAGTFLQSGDKKWTRAKIKEHREGKNERDAILSYLGWRRPWLVKVLRKKYSERTVKYAGWHRIDRWIDIVKNNTDLDQSVKVLRRVI